MQGESEPNRIDEEEPAGVEAVLRVSGLNYTPPETVTATSSNTYNVPSLSALRRVTERERV